MRYLLIALVLAGCTAAQDAADNLARTQAKQVVNSQVATVLPGVDLAFATDCIIDSASSQEILTLASASVTGVDAKSAQLIQNIAARPAVLQCILAKRFPGVAVQVS